MSKTVKARASRPYDITDPRQIAALASSTRQSIVDLVQSAGPLTVSEIAERVNRRADSIYYHLKTLVKVGLLLESFDAEVRGRSIATYDVPGRPLRLRYDLSSKASTRALNRVAQSMLRGAYRDFARHSLGGRAVVTGPERELWAARGRAMLSPKELREVNRLLSRLVSLMSPHKTEEDATMFEITFVLSPGS